jgi:hypothetical protein
LAAAASLVAVFFLADITHDVAHVPLPALAGAETFCEGSPDSHGPVRAPGKDRSQPGCSHHFHGYPDRTPALPTPAIPVIVALVSKPFLTNLPSACKRLRSLPNDSGRSPPLA